MCEHSEDVRLQRVKANIKDYEDFPKKGIIFRDVFPLFHDPSLLDDVIQLFEQCIQTLDSRVDAIVGLESRGFLIGPILALRLRLPFIPIRKAGKLPGKVRSVGYELEYGSDIFEVQENSIKPNLICVIVDDLLATGGSIKTAIQLIEKCGGQVAASMIIVELADLDGRKMINCPVHSLVKYS